MMSNVCKVFKIFDPLPLVRFWQLIYTIKFTQPPLLCLLFGDLGTLSPLSTDIIKVWP